jgi:putative oxidoreductase
MRALQDLAALLARLLLSFIFVMEGLVKLGDLAGTADYMQAYGVSPRLLPLVILTELGGGLCVALGLLTRLAAPALAGFCLLTALLFHADFANQMQLIQATKNLAIAGGFLLLAAFGPGRWSLDAWRRRNG